MNGFNLLCGATGKAFASLHVEPGIAATRRSRRWPIQYPRASFGEATQFVPEGSAVGGSVDETPLLGYPGYGPRICNIGQRVTRSQQPLLPNVGSDASKRLEFCRAGSGTSRELHTACRG